MLQLAASRANAASRATISEHTRRYANNANHTTEHERRYRHVISRRPSVRPDIGTVACKHHAKAHQLGRRYRIT